MRNAFTTSPLVLLGVAGMLAASNAMAMAYFRGPPGPEGRVVCRYYPPINWPREFRRQLQPHESVVAPGIVNRP
jgi:hypothetical protein